MKERQRWQPEEDSLLRAYVKQYGPKEWNLISQRMGGGGGGGNKTLDRDPKSCLERWKNYLKPGIKKGSLTPDEQTLVISLQSKYGNKWKKIASEVPGRTPKRLGKWWEVFKEKQLKIRKKKTTSTGRPPGDFTHPPPPPPSVSSAAGGYDHILETFAEKYVHPQLFAFHQSLPFPVAVNVMMPNLEPAPLLSLGSLGLPEPGNHSISTTASSSVLPPWMSSTNIGSTTTTTSSLSSASSSATPSPSVSLTLSSSEPAVVLDPDLGLSSRFLPVQQMGTLVQYCKELEEGRHNWLQHKKESTWRLNRLEQQLESEKSRKRREKMEEIEEKIRYLREEEMGFLGRLESEYRDQLTALHREAETKEAKLMEAWGGKHVKLTKLVEQIGVHGFTIVHN